MLMAGFVKNLDFMKNSNSFLSRLYTKVFPQKEKPTVPTTADYGSGIMSFAHTGDVIRAEEILRKAGMDVEVKAPPPQMRTGCDMVLIFPLIEQIAAQEMLKRDHITPVDITDMKAGLLEPASLSHVTDYGEWLMVRVANMKITVRKSDRLIVNISGGGCPDVPFMSALLTGRILDEAPEPRSMGRTLCCYSLQKAFMEIKKSCGLL